MRSFKRYLAYYVCGWATLIDVVMIILTFGLVSLTPARDIVYSTVDTAFYNARWWG